MDSIKIRIKYLIPIYYLIQKIIVDKKHLKLHVQKKKQHGLNMRHFLVEFKYEVEKENEI